MAISGGIKFFKKSKSLFALGGTAVASTNSESAKNVLTSNKFVKWQSFGSNDTITETITITMPSSVIDRIFLIAHNFKEFTIKYDVAGTPTDFTNVTGLDGVVAPIAETAYNKDTAYYEFDAVTTTIIYITVTKSQVVDAQKSLERFYCTEELGTLTGFPTISKEELDQNINKQTTLSGNLSAQKRLETFSCSIDFKNYPAIQNDYNIIDTLATKPESFLIWLCGGKYGENFSIVRRNWQLKDVYNVQMMGKLSVKWLNNIYLAGFSGKMKIEQSTEVR
jgi:hypothetical protein